MILRRRWGSVEGKALLATLARGGAAAVIMIAVIILSRPLAAGLGELTALGMQAAAGAGVYFLSLWLLGERF